MQQLVTLLAINCSSTCSGHLYAHHQEVRLRFTAYGFLSCKRKTVRSVVLWRVELYCIIVVCVCISSVSLLRGSELVVGTVWGGVCGAGDGPVWGCVVVRVGVLRGAGP